MQQQRLGVLRAVVLLVALHGSVAQPQTQRMDPDDTRKFPSQVVMKGDKTKVGSSEEQHMNPAPFPECPLYEVGPEQPLPPVAVNGSLSMALYPSHSSLSMTLQLDQMLYKASVEGTMIKLVKCESENVTCTTVDQGGTKDSDLLDAQRWNFIRITILNQTATVDINTKANVMVMSLESDETVGKAVVLVPDSSNQTLVVNIHCNDTYTPYIHPPATSEPVVDTSPKPEPQGRPVGLIVGLLIGLLFIIVVAVAAFYYKRRSSLNINQNTPLCEQQQQK